jgi:hypothetical protein
LKKFFGKNFVYETIFRKFSGPGIRFPESGTAPPHSLYPLTSENFPERSIPWQILPISKTASFSQKEVILDDLAEPEILSAPKIRGIQRKRYNNEILSAGLGSDWIFHDVVKNPG